MRDAFPLAGYMPLMLIAGSVGAIAIVGEYGSGLIRTTTAAVPARGEVLAAKAVVLAALWTVVGAVTAIGSFVTAQALLSGRGAGVALTEAGAFRAVAASALLAPVCALLGLGLGFLIRHGAATVVATAATLLLLPGFFSRTEYLTALINHAMVYTAWTRLTDTWPPYPRSPFHEPSIAGSWVVYAAWPLLAVTLALLVVRRRDV
ncbi:hypothetical protein [Streptomyces sp. SBT349]|uniref:hypothetical protein n=1 Tax=Streptomyces sp. SBT349 TaxID=1580539 RepID=UPI00069F5C69|nr:hypothetical protein [Streptomyces sp. SBT349]